MAKEAKKTPIRIDLDDLREAVVDYYAKVYNMPVTPEEVIFTFDEDYETKELTGAVVNIGRDTFRNLIAKGGQNAAGQA